MIGSAVARIYAVALFELAQEEGALEDRLEEVKELLGIFQREKRFRAVLESPNVNHTEKESLLREVFGDAFSEHLRSLILLLVRKNRHFYVEPILKAFVVIYQESKGRIRAAVTTAIPLKEEEAAQLVDGLSRETGKEVLLDWEIDPDLLSGAVLRYGDYIVDGSLKTRIRLMKESLLATSDQ